MPSSVWAPPRLSLLSMMVASLLSTLHPPVDVDQLGTSPMAAYPKMYCLLRFAPDCLMLTRDRQNANGRKVRKPTGVMRDKSSAKCLASFVIHNSML